MRTAYIDFNRNANEDDNHTKMIIAIGMLMKIIIVVEILMKK